MRNEGDHTYISDLATSRRSVLTQLARSLQTRIYRKKRRRRRRNRKRGGKRITDKYKGVRTNTMKGGR